jgi:hypothetical protein
MLGQDERLTKFKAQGTIDDVVAVSARLVLERFNGQQTEAAQADAYLVGRMREMYAVLCRTGL